MPQCKIDGLLGILHTSRLQLQSKRISLLQHFFPSVLAQKKSSRIREVIPENFSVIGFGLFSSQRENRLMNGRIGMPPLILSSGKWRERRSHVRRPKVGSLEGSK
ncbi:hypothetical protein CEXT_632731 [Caerostris extrusa]|uniref:Uncharacterized protein n=1 Tax=Caerostris extrusa TaxID=172846 RepID=A0AAV4MEU7_CAEEX|nr:hypothetical protein CEXT_632731 [Caerostris extrusa]